MDRAILLKNTYTLSYNRQVMVYDFYYASIPEDEDRNSQYEARFQLQLKAFGITADKIIKIDQVDEQHERVHVMIDGGIEQYAIVKFEPPPTYKVPEEFDLNTDDWYVYMGEIPNMPGHCIVANYKTGRLHCGHHIPLFKVINDI